MIIYFNTSFVRMNQIQILTKHNNKTFNIDSNKKNNFFNKLITEKNVKYKFKYKVVKNKLIFDWRNINASYLNIPTFTFVFNYFLKGKIYKNANFLCLLKYFSILADYTYPSEYLYTVLRNNSHYYNSSLKLYRMNESLNYLLTPINLLNFYVVSYVIFKITKDQTYEVMDSFKNNIVNYIKDKYKRNSLRLYLRLNFINIQIGNPCYYDSKQNINSCIESLEANLQFVNDYIREINTNSTKITIDDLYKEVIKFPNDNTQFQEIIRIFYFNHVLCKKYFEARNSTFKHVLNHTIHNYVTSTSKSNFSRTFKILTSLQSLPEINRNDITFNYNFSQYQDSEIWRNVLFQSNLIFTFFIQKTDEINIPRYYDMYFYDISLEEAKNKLTIILGFWSNKYEYMQYTNRDTIDISALESNIHIYIHLRVYSSINDILSDIPLDSESYLFNMQKNYFVTDRFKYSMKHVMNTLNFNNYSDYINEKLAYYAGCGFSIYIPEFDHSQINEQMLKAVKDRIKLDKIIVFLSGVRVVKSNVSENIENYFKKVVDLHKKRLQIWYNSKSYNLNYFYKTYIKNIDLLLFNKYIKYFNNMPIYPIDSDFNEMIGNRFHYDNIENDIRSITPQEYFKGLFYNKDKNLYNLLHINDIKIQSEDIVALNMYNLLFDKNASMSFSYAKLESKELENIINNNENTNFT